MIAMVILVLYAYEMVFIGVENLTTGCKENMAIKFEMKDIAMGYYSLGLEVLYRLWAR